MKVYIVLKYSTIREVFSTEEKAKKYISEYIHPEAFTIISLPLK
ncbi:hypothetical protein [Chondrinema litorale]|nr:hypothetical protein [Chondrinema litorale]UZS00243.1 hypothetical protein OQ292_40595 [Chondrinema litorale]